MQAFPRLRHLAYRIRYRCRGVPFRICGQVIRLDETLRRWDVENESQIQLTLSNYLRPGDCVYDIGANFGLHTLLAGRLVGPRGEVHAFEPLPSNLQKLRRHVELNGLQHVIRVIPTAVSNSQRSTISFFSGADEAGVTASLRPRQGNEKEQEVANTRLDAYYKIFNSRVRLIKIDVEGAELEVLRGARRLLIEQRPLLIIEVHAFAFPEFATTEGEFNDFLKSLGYEEQVLRQTAMRDPLHYQAVYKSSNTLTS